MRIVRWWALLSVLGLVCLSTGEPLALAQKVKNVETVGQYLARLFKTPAFAPLREPDRVEALPVQIIGEGLSSDFRTVEKPVALDAQTMHALRTAFGDTHSYGGFTACMFEPAVALRFHQGAKSIQAVICFKCGELIFQDAAGQDLTGRLSFNEARKPLLAAARKAFPQNQTLRGLPQ